MDHEVEYYSNQLALVSVLKLVLEETLEEVETQFKYKNLNQERISDWIISYVN